MKTSLIQIGILSILLASSHPAKAADENFPALGSTYNVTWAKDAYVGKAQITIIRKGEGSWIFVKYSNLYLPPEPPRQPGPPNSDKPSKPPVWVKSEVNAREMWVNTQWLVDATEINSEKKE